MKVSLWHLGDFSKRCPCFIFLVLEKESAFCCWQTFFALDVYFDLHIKFIRLAWYNPIVP